MRSRNNTSFMELFNEGKLLSNDGEFYEAHIVWEYIWKEGDQEIRNNIKGLILLSAGVLKYRQGNYKAAEYLLEKALKM